MKPINGPKWCSPTAACEDTNVLRFSQERPTPRTSSTTATSENRAEGMRICECPNGLVRNEQDTVGVLGWRSLRVSRGGAPGVYGLLGL
eukprot:1180961-Prorocentrum_minimum.AAC.1